MLATSGKDDRFVPASHRTFEDGKFDWISSSFVVVFLGGCGDDVTFLISYLKNSVVLDVDFRNVISNRLKMENKFDYSRL